MPPGSKLMGKSNIKNIFSNRMQTAAGRIPQLGLWAVSLTSGKTQSNMTLHQLNNGLGCAVLMSLLSGFNDGNELRVEEGLRLSLCCTTVEWRGSPCSGNQSPGPQSAVPGMPRDYFKVLASFSLLFLLWLLHLPN